VSSAAGLVRYKVRQLATETKQAASYWRVGSATGHPGRRPLGGTVLVRLSLALIAATLVPGCMLTPRTGDFVDHTLPLEVSGLGSRPNAEIRIEAYHQRDNRWDRIATTTTSGSPLAIGGYDFFYYTTDVQFSQMFEMPCYFDAGCDMGTEGVYDIRLRGEEVGGDGGRLFTFDDDSYDCTYDRIFGLGEDAYSAYWTCKQPIHDEVTLHVAIVH
jgi:hypothetical protein